MRRLSNIESSKINPEIIGGNMDIEDSVEAVNWQRTPKEFGLTNQEIANVFAANELNQYMRDLSSKGKTLTEEEKLKEFQILKKENLETLSLILDDDFEE
jgi:hypothetical protein